MYLTENDRRIIVQALDDYFEGVYSNDDAPEGLLDDVKRLAELFEGDMLFEGMNMLDPDEQERSTEAYARAINEANTLTPYLAMGAFYDGDGNLAWESAGVFQADDAVHALEQAQDAEHDGVEWIIVPVEHVYRKAVE